MRLDRTISRPSKKSLATSDEDCGVAAFEQQRDLEAAVVLDLG
jgi:hypothetical protein